MPDDFTGTKVVLTGACGVFGRRIAAAFAQNGALLCLSDMSEGALRDLRDQLSSASGEHLVHETELCDADSINRLTDLVEQRWGAPDIVINNAAVYPSGLLLDIDTVEWDRIMDTNLRAPYLISRSMARLMVKSGSKGNIVNISSGAARNLRASVVPYCVSKSALDRLSRGLALELAPHGIRVNVVEPGFAPGSTASPLPKEHVEKVLKGIPLGRPSGPDDAPNAIMYLCSERASYITGATLSVDGGNSIGSSVVFQKEGEGRENGA